MGASIKNIQIKNFRSIRNLQADASQLSVFVGKNDSGKSNILRALNLFFNGKTNPNSNFNFMEDYNFFSPADARRAKEISVKLEIALPISYRKTNGDVIIWEKRWREEGLWSEEYDYFGERISNNRRGREIRERVDIPDKSNVHSLLRKIEFEYVPAIKDSEYFSDLRGRIYGIISEVASRTFHTSSTAFEQAIGDHLNDLTCSITESLGFETRLALPRDLYHIFERLDFLSGEKAVSLENRGDGIKARHIPLILRFMANKKAELQQRGGQPISHIWAYEEPENNLELASAIELADELKLLANSEVAQILLTTHSPAFYDLGSRDESVNLNFVTRRSDKDGTIIKKDINGIDESLGTLALLAPRISEMVSQVREQEKAKHDAQKLAETNCARIFVEGESDKIILEKAIEVFFPSQKDLVKFETKESGAGHSYVIDMLVGWRSHHKHHPELPKSAGIVDSDARNLKNDFNRQPDNTKSAKCFCYPHPQEFNILLHRGFNVPITLECLYPKEVWIEALRRGDLKERDTSEVYPKTLINQILKGEVNSSDHIDKEWEIYVNHDFSNHAKIQTARRICRKDDAECYELLKHYRGIISSILEYLELVSR